MKLKNLSFTRLLKLELPEFAERVIGIVEEHNPEELKIEAVFDLLVKEQPQIDLLTVRYGAHPMTAELNRLRELRQLYLSAIAFRLRVVTKEDITQSDPAVILVDIEINRFLKKLRPSKNEEVINRMITRFFAELEANEELEAALSSLEFTVHLNELRSVHFRIQKLLGKRLKSISKRPKIKTAALRKSVCNALKNLFKEIELAPLRNPELDYKELFDELNDLMDKYRNLINIRMGYNQRIAEQKAEIENGELDEPTEVDESVEPTGMTMRHLNVEDDNSKNGLDVKPINEKKTTTSSSKPMQLPDNKNDKDN